MPSAAIICYFVALGAWLFVVGLALGFGIGVFLMGKIMDDLWRLRHG